MIVEDGSVVPGANSYCSVSAADAHHAARGVSEWVDADEEFKAFTLISATDYLTQTYRTLWRGYRTSTLQDLDWPRVDVYVPGEHRVRRDHYDAFGSLARGEIASNIVPPEVVRACADLALRVLRGETLLPDEGQRVASKRVDSLSITYQPNSSPRKRYAAVDGLLQPLLQGTPGGASVRLTRS